MEGDNNWDSAWPRLSASRQRHKVLAWLEGNRLITEHGEIMTIESLSDLSVKCGGMDVYLDSVLRCNWYSDLANMGAISCTPEGVPIGARVKAKRGYIYLTSANKWTKKYRGYSFLQWLRKLFDYCGGGDYLTPASLGLAIWEQCYLSEGFRRQRKPSRGLMAALEEGMVGGRVDFMADKQHEYGLAHEIDMNNAYATAARVLPSGTPVYLPEDCIESVDEVLAYPVAYGKYYVTLPGDIPLGVVPIRGEAGENTRYMHEQGGTVAWLWTDEVKAALCSGYVLIPVFAWCWEGMEAYSSYWHDRMVWLRENALDKEMAACIKLAIVGAIGKQGSTGTVYELTTEETDIPILDGWEPGDYYVLEKKDFTRRGMKQWQSFIMARVRVWLFERMKAEMAAGNTVIATNYDAIYLTGAPRVTEDRLWKHKEMRDVRFPYPRAIIVKGNPQATRLPGTIRSVAA